MKQLLCHSSGSVPLVITKLSWANGFMTDGAEFFLSAAGCPGDLSLAQPGG